MSPAEFVFSTPASARAGQSLLRRAVPWMLGLSALAAMIVSFWLRAAAATADSYTPITAVPPNVQTVQPKPLVMLNMSRDHQLFYRAYNEFSDYNNDGQPDGSYLHTVRYSGYFDSRKCYTYTGDDGGRYNPTVLLGSHTDLCTGTWHGNFLNWATMTRMDVLRKVLYGGTRVRETAALTVLERASLPMDAHSFAKYYVAASPVTSERPAISSLTPFSETEITICNTTLGDNATVSHQNTNPPLMRVARGNYALWNAHERRQCRWSEETIWVTNGGDNGNVPATTGFAANANYPSRGTQGLNVTGSADGDYTVRVSVCVAGPLLEGERCREYPSGAARPIGLLQEYGEVNDAEFGLLTGSFSNNVSGGVLRKNASSFRNEVNYLTDGSFIAGAGGIVATLDRLKVYGYRYTDGVYAARDNGNGENGFCAFQTVGLSNNSCGSWGNPIGEMYIETLRYLKGLQPSATYGNNTDAKGALLGLTVATWVDPLTDEGAANVARAVEFGPAACRPINVVNFNASVVSYDGDDTGPFAELGAASAIDTYTNAVGAGESINGTMRFVGNNSAAGTDNTCTAKSLTGLADARGLCPAAPAYRGSYSLAGAAYWANTNPIRPVPATLGAEAQQRAFRVRTYGVALAPGVPRIQIRTAAGLDAEIQPSYRLNVGGGIGSGTLVDFRVISQTASGGRYLVIWEDSEQGGDYDQDFSGILEWNLNGNTLTVTTSRIGDSTLNPQGFGYITSGTNHDGVHFHTGIYGFTFNDPTNLPVVGAGTTVRPAHINATGGCQGCTSGNGATTATYTVTGGAGRQLQDPMLYAARWGGFRDDSTGIASGTPPGAGLANDIPRTYFEVFNPDELERSLRAAFADIVRVSNTAPAVSSSQLVSGSFKYTARYDPRLLLGDVDAFEINDSTRNFSTARSWNAGQKLSAMNADARQIITADITATSQTGIPFTWEAIDARPDYRAALLAGTRTLSPQHAEDLVSFMRGSRTVEGNAGGNGFRTRADIVADNNYVLGTIVSAAPWVQSAPSARFLESRNPGYRQFAQANRSRTNVLWIAANDGMLHGLNASTGDPLLSYVPRALVPRLNELVVDGQGIRAFVDGSPFSADVDLNAGGVGAPQWRTYVFGTLGRGGRGIFALDATDTANLTAANAASVFRWEFNADDDPDGDLGHVISDISLEPGTGQASPVVRMADGTFAVVLGNGTNSRSGRAVLFVLQVRGPNNGSWTGRYNKIVLASGPANGLSAPVLLDLDNDGRIDTAYAGDLQGNLWKIDLSSATPTNWRSAYLLPASTTPSPLYVATAADGTTRLPITGAPQVAFPRFGGALVTVATGRSINTGDFPRLGVNQRVYGIWDRPAFATGARALPRGLGTLTPRTIERDANGDLVTTAATTIDYQNTDALAARDGWYFNLPGASEMVVSNIGFRANTVFFTSIRPPGTALTNCSAQPDSSLYAFDPVAGAPTRSVLGTVEINGVQTPILGRSVADQKLRDAADATRETLPRTAEQEEECRNNPGRCAPTCPDGSAATRFVGSSTSITACTPQNNARRQWREIPGLRTR